MQTYLALAYNIGVITVAKHGGQHFSDLTAILHWIIWRLILPSLVFLDVIFHYATQLFQNTANNDDTTMRRNGVLKNAANA